PATESRSMALLRDPGRARAPVLARGQFVARPGRPRHRRDPRQPHRRRGDGHQHGTLQVAGLRSERGLHRGGGSLVGLRDRLRRAGLLQRVLVGDAPDRQRHRRSGVDFRRRVRGVVHPVRPELGPGHLQGSTLGDLRRVPDRVHVPHAVWHRRGDPATLDPGYPVPSSTGGTWRRSLTSSYNDVNGGVFMRRTPQLLALVLALGMAAVSTVPAGAQTVVGVTATAIKYVNQQKVPHLFVATGATKWDDPKNFPWTMGFQPNYQTEGRVYAAYILKNIPDAKIGILYQNDDYGKDYVKGMEDGLGAAASKLIVLKQSHEVTDPTIDSQIINLKNSGANVFFNVTIPKFAVQAIRKAHDIGWKPTHFLNNVSSSYASVLKPAGVKT